MMISRRVFLAAAAGAVAAVHPLAEAELLPEPETNDEGLYVQPFFMETFLDLSEDLEETRAEGKRFAVIWEQAGCSYCKEMHMVNLRKPEIHDYVSNNFGVVRLNLWGSRAVTDFDGETLEERKLARKWRVNFTPTIQFFPGSLAEIGNQSGASVEVARMPGYFKPFSFLTMFEYVKERAYEEAGFQRYLQDKIERLEAEQG